MLDFKEKRKMISLETEVDGVEISIHEEAVWDKTLKRYSDDECVFKLYVGIKDDIYYNGFDITTETLEQAKEVATEVLELMKKIRPMIKSKVINRLDSEN